MITHYSGPRFGLPERIKGVPLPAIQIIALLVLVNAIVWAACAVVLHFNPSLIGTAALSYTLGLRHALDADHIAAIDLMTRRLIASGQQPVTVGTFFSLGHSTIVIITCIVVAATSGALRDRFDNFSHVGGIIGTSVSAAFLLLLCIGNGWVLYRLVVRLRQVLRPSEPHLAREDGEGEDAFAAHNLQLEGAGFMANLLRKVFRIIDRPWKMYPLGILFGLGFDTSSEIAIIGIASIQGARNTSLWVILIFPLLFTAGMCLLDTTDGALMMALYTNKAFARDTVAILYYSIVLTGITVVVSAFIGIIQILSLVQNVAEPSGNFWDGVSAISDNYDVIGGSICGLFLIVGIASVVIYRPWRRRVERRRAQQFPSSNSQDVAIPTGRLCSTPAQETEPEIPELLRLDSK
ncbi:High-affinity nickel transport protein nic1 [Colletotrichum truncatum]|uniref:High-affinity nickel transport protein nic1 n=1 Tax=Colletotrichum truncatum TaxID=5467 RepID=A0ACC3ZG83_COLTU|nr:High-affinity nickel transport protein nic1 [Colletotrichum truncatum]KAF6801995.1 High-affinity nickel transport protein nic1 [Colletotrichum truncatum]